MKFRLLGAAAAACAMATAAAPEASAQEPYLGEVTIFPYNFCPRGWAPADGQLLPISQNSALFSLYGTMYGGDGRTTFALPDLRGRVPMHHGQGPGLTQRRLGEKLGSEVNVIAVPGLPAHTHGVAVTQTVISSDDRSGRRGGRDDDDDDHGGHGGDHHSGGGSADVTITTVATDGTGTGLMQTSAVGGSQSVNNIQPTAVVQYCVALQGIFPSRN